MYRTYLDKATHGASNHAQTRLHTYTHTHTEMKARTPRTKGKVTADFF